MIYHDSSLSCKDLFESSADDFIGNRGCYALKYTSDQLLDALSMSNDNSFKDAVVSVLDLQEKFEGLVDKELDASEPDLLNILIYKFYTNSDPNSFRNLLFSNNAVAPEYSFKVAFLKCCTLLVERKELSYYSQMLCNEFGIDKNNLELVNKLKMELELDLGTIYDIDDDKFVALWE